MLNSKQSTQPCFQSIGVPGWRPKRSCGPPKRDGSVFDGTAYGNDKNKPLAGKVKYTNGTGPGYAFPKDIPRGLVKITTDEGTEYVLLATVPPGSIPCSSGGSGTDTGTGSSAAVPGTTSDSESDDDGDSGSDDDGDSGGDGEGGDGGDPGSEAEDGGGTVGDAVVLATGKGKGRRNGPRNEFVPLVQPRPGQSEKSDKATISANLLEQAGIESTRPKGFKDVRGLTYLQMEDTILDFKRAGEFPYVTFEKLVTDDPRLNGIQEGAEGTTLTSSKFGRGRVVSSRRQEPQQPQKSKRGKKTVEVANKTQTVAKSNRVFTIRYGKSSGTENTKPCPCFAETSSHLYTSFR